MRVRDLYSDVVQTLPEMKNLGDVFTSEYFTGPSIYVIFCDADGKYYVGSTKDTVQRLMKHRALFRSGLHPNKHLVNAYNLYGERRFWFKVIESKQWETTREMLADEKKWIVDLDAVDSGFNKRREPSSNAGIFASEETKMKLSAIVRARLQNPEYREKMASCRRSNSIALKEWYKRNGHPRKGKKENPAATAKRAAALRGRKWTQEMKEAHTARLRANPPPRKNNIEYRLMSPEGVIYEGRDLSNFGRKMGLTKSVVQNLRSVMKGTRTHSGGWVKVI